MPCFSLPSTQQNFYFVEFLTSLHAIPSGDGFRKTELQQIDVLLSLATTRCLSESYEYRPFTPPYALIFKSYVRQFSRRLLGDFETVHTVTPSLSRHHSPILTPVGD